MTNINFKSVVIIGVGLIGSSIARAIKEKEVSKTIYGIDPNEENLQKCLNLKIISKGKKNLIDLKEQTDLIIIWGGSLTFFIGDKHLSANAFYLIGTGCMFNWF